MVKMVVLTNADVHIDVQLVAKREQIVKEWEKKYVRIWLVESSLGLKLFFYHKQVPIPIDSEWVFSLGEADTIVQNFLIKIQ